MSTFEAILLGIIQGLTEFLPVSSSGHLALFQYFLGFKNLDQYLLFDVICHLGTLTSILIIFRQQVIDMLFKNRTLFLQVVLATTVLFPCVLALKEIKMLFNQLQYLGFFFLMTAALLQLGISYGYEKTTGELEKSKWRDGVIIGLFQAIALLPGVSRSGSTISGARLIGWEVEKAIHFSFLLAIPAILGAASLELFEAFSLATPLPDMTTATYFAGFITSLIFGCFALLLLIRLADKRKFHYFVYYCALLGVLTLFIFNI